jgi:hypothetical protein
VKSVPQFLQTAFQKKRVIPVVGAGVSMSIKDQNGKSVFPSWTGLLSKCADRLREEEKPKLAAALSANVEIGRFKEAADIAREGLTGRLWGSFFRDVFSINRNNLSESSLQLAKAVWRISDRIVTLNYDKVLRLASEFPDSVLELDNGSTAELADFCRGSLGEPAIWHLHGKFDNSANIVFTTESYDKLYADKNSSYLGALEAFRSLIRNDTLIFVGCSLEDADILFQIAREHDIFEGNAGPHYALVAANQIALIKQKLTGLPIELIPFKDFGQPLIDLVNEITSETHASQAILPPDRAAEESANARSQNIKISVLSANPIGKDLCYRDEFREIKKLKCHVEYAPLTVRSLNELSDCDYLILLSQTFKNRVLVETNALSSDLLTLSQIEESVGASPKGIIVFSNYDGADIAKLYENEHLSFPTLILPTLNKQQIESIFFKIFKKKDLKSIPGSTIHRLHDFEINDLTKEYTEFRPRASLPQSIDAKATSNYVGRQTDLESIAAKIVELSDRNQILTIKGSGGIGKTITIKKIVVELANRNHFSDGIEFIDCESVADFKNFEFRVARGFDLEKVANLQAHLSATTTKRNSLLVLDNFESLIHSSDAEKIIDFVSYLCDFTNIVTTSRELIGTECELVYELRPFTTDEAYDLFAKEYRHDIKNASDTKIIREEILEQILDNNPLAIKLITKNIPKGKDFKELSAELENNFFMALSNAEITAFDNIEDVNIERKRSLYASINYSYQHLDEIERKAFELLSLFPDGISLEHFKLISSAQHGAKRGARQKKPYEWRGHILITDQAIRSLENKSVIQIDNGLIKLQSIIGRFASQMLKTRDKSELEQFYRNAFHYNYALLDALATGLSEDLASPSRVFNAYQANFVRCLDYANDVVPNSFELLDYLDSLSLLFIGISAPDTYLREMQKRPFLKFRDERMQLSLDVSFQSARYYFGEFAEAFDDLKSLVSLEQLQELDGDDRVEWLTIANASDIYCIEGNALAISKLYAKTGYAPRDYPHPLLQIGELDIKLARSSCNDFFTFEALRALGLLTVKALDDYLSGMYTKSHLERTQTMYVKAKLTSVPKQTVKKLVTINPYTAGLKILMLAFVESDSARKCEYFDEALSHLLHVKYYYVECLYFYAKFLHEDAQIEKFEKTHAMACEMAEDHNFRYLKYLIDGIKMPNEAPYSSNAFPLSDGTTFQGYISHIVRRQQQLQ